ncbi:hypothetical protein BOX15_Mlig034301g3, partial [Macrostomum lignano]
GLESHSAAIFVQSADANGKELLFVKLTDAALRGLEEAARHSRGQTGFVSFDGPANELQLPGGSSFALAISDAVQGSDQLDLVQPAGAQPHQSGHPTIGRLGAVLKKVTVQAKDDVYSNTKEKITQADQNEKRVRTKELKSNSSAKQRLLKRSLNSGHLSSGAAPPKRPATPLGGGHGSRPTPPHAAATTAGSRSLRDHVIHLLAVRPYNQAELLIRLRQNNLTVEAPALTRVLDEVGRLEPNRSRYILLPGLLAQVSLDWPLYSQTEKERLRDRKAALQQRQTAAAPVTGSIVSSSSAAAAANAKDKDAATPVASSASVAPTQSSNSQPLPHQPAPPPVQSSQQSADSSSPSSEASPTIALAAASAPASASASASAAAAPEDDLKPIVSAADRARYKTEYDRDYPEYRRLWDRIRSVTVKAMELEQQLEKQSRGSPGYEATCERIIELYKHCQSQPEFRLDAEHFMTMEKRLRRIRQLIVDYDRYKAAGLAS